MSPPAPPSSPAAASEPQEGGPGQVFLLRHGQTEWSESGQHTGRTDVPLTDAGREQASRLVGLLAAQHLTDPFVMSSPRRRALDTARLAGLTVAETTHLLAEWDYGDYEGRTSEEIQQEVPGWTLWTHDTPAGERPGAVQERADAVLARARELITHRDVVLVGHGHFSRVLMARWIGLPVTAGVHFALSPGGLAILGHDHGYPRLAAMNVTPP
ncbi:acid phosphatase [Rhodococcus sp. X156]|uniref:acid phosphatase n=1 Tax=Rhodococcus sp. X156 TaxID=2499145 RepID=UPI000FD98A19|nr:acid phosphatase [Rhodococcus sp. X156]